MSGVARSIEDNWERGVRDLLALRVGQKLRHRGGSIAHVRSVLVEDEVVVVRTWSRRRRWWNYAIIGPEDLIAGPYTLEKAR